MQGDLMPFTSVGLDMADTILDSKPESFSLLLRTKSHVLPLSLPLTCVTV